MENEIPGKVRKYCLEDYRLVPHRAKAISEAGGVVDLQYCRVFPVMGMCHEITPPADIDTFAF